MLCVYLYGNCTFLDPLKNKLINLDIQPSDYLGKLFKNQVNTSISYHVNNAKNKEHNDMITQKNQTGKKPREDLTQGGFNLAILKVKQIYYERIEVLQQQLKPLTYYCYLEQTTYYHNHVTASSPRTTSFLDSQLPQVLPLVFFFKLLKQQLKRSPSSRHQS